MAAPQSFSGVMTPHDSMHLRVKRRHSTVFLLCYPEQPVSAVKAKICQIFKRELGTFRLLYKDMILDDEASLRAQQIGSNDVVHLIFKDEKSEGYEKVEFDDLEKMHLDYEAKAKTSS
eukprot:CAMPEP_0114640908 /NCGR_PEP_ID=MMETSP0191-20121206/1961_1 /TAXON_ID=126664 /ORGANISM="Sorites sp." /LENGTH=117 /DNA_ID=CAMNT_0001852887 /DNA_START=12 /DNA_END=365 /DNA_ORIENTATION=-